MILGPNLTNVILTVLTTGNQESGLILHVIVTHGLGQTSNVDSTKQFYALISHVQLKSKSYVNKQWKPFPAFSRWHWHRQGTISDVFVLLFHEESCYLHSRKSSDRIFFLFILVLLVVHRIQHKGVKSIPVFIMSVFVLNSLECQSDRDWHP